MLCQKQTAGLLSRRHVQIEHVRFVGKESNALEDAEAGLVHDGELVYTEYCDQARDEWITKLLPSLKKLPLAVLITRILFSRRALIDLRAGRRRPHSKNQKLIETVLERLRPSRSLIRLIALPSPLCTIRSWLFRRLYARPKATLVMFTWAAPAASFRLQNEAGRYS